MHAQEAVATRRADRGLNQACRLVGVNPVLYTRRQSKANHTRKLLDGCMRVYARTLSVQ